MQDRCRLLADQLGGRLMEATNRNLYILSIVTTMFLPMTLLTGIFGMNLGGLPWQQDPHGFWYGMVMMLVLAIVAFVCCDAGGCFSAAPAVCAHILTRSRQGIS